MITIDCSAAKPVKVCVVWLVGQVTTRRVTEVASPSPMCWPRGLPPKLPLLPTTRTTQTVVPSGCLRSASIRAPSAERLDLTPTSLTSASAVHDRGSGTTH